VDGPVAVLDACVLIPMPVADTLLRLAEPPALYEARWSEHILAEVTRNLIGRFGKSPEKARYRESAMRKFFPDSLVRDYEPLISEMKNHPKDRHVLAAGVASRAGYVVTFNLKDFPSEAVGKYDIAAIGPSAFLKQLLVQDRALVKERLRDQASAIGIPINQLLDRLAASVPGFVSAFREA
jgi:hypothetical protein